MSTVSVTDICQDSLEHQEVKRVVEDYTGLYDEARGGGVHARKAQYTTLVNNFYDLVTDFYEYGWGDAFHFAPRHRGESFPASLARHEMQLAHRLGLRPGMKVADVGCGVGGPMRVIARFSGAHIVGINNNDYQIGKARQYNVQARLDGLCELLKADFLHIPLPDGSFGAAYAIEATCHAPDKRAIYGEIFRVLKPGACFALYDWCMTDRYEPTDARHRAIKEGIEKADALPELVTTREALAAMQDVGFTEVAGEDLALTSDPETPWYLPLADKWYKPQGFRSTRAGRWLTHQAVRALEAARVAPRGATAVSSFLEAGAEALVKGGQTGIFTPMYYLFGRKPG